MIYLDFVAFALLLVISYYNALYNFNDLTLLHAAQMA